MVWKTAKSRSAASFGRGGDEFTFVLDLILDGLERAPTSLPGQAES